MDYNKANELHKFIEATMKAYYRAYGIKCHEFKKKPNWMKKIKTDTTSMIIRTEADVAIGNKEGSILIDYKRVDRPHFLNIEALPFLRHLTDRESWGIRFAYVVGDFYQKEETKPSFFWFPIQKHPPISSLVLPTNKAYPDKETLKGWATDEGIAIEERPVGDNASGDPFIQIAREEFVRCENIYTLLEKYGKKKR